MPIVLAVVLVLIVSLTLALFTETKSGTRTFTLSNFGSEVVVYFGNNGSAVSPSGSAGGGSYYDVSLSENDANFLGDLHINVKYQGVGVGLIRVRLAEEWSTTASGTRTVYPYKLELPYTVSSVYSGTGNQRAWFDNRSEDHCFYYATPVSSTGNSTISLVQGVDTSNMDFGAIAAQDLRILVKADVVQVNRYPQYWGMTDLPWNDSSNNASSLTQMEPTTTP